MSYSREEFEQAFLNQYTDFERFENGEYMDDFLQQSWIGWQARAKTDDCCSEIPNSCEPVYFYQEPEAVGSNKWREIPGRTLEKQKQQSHFRGFKHRTLYTHPVSANDAKHHAVLQAQIWAQEARTQKAIVKEIGEMVGCANDWEMVEAVRNALATLPPNEHGKNRYGLEARVAELESDEQEIAGDNNV